MRDNFKRYLVKHFSKYGYTMTLKQLVKYSGHMEFMIRDALRSKLCEKRHNPVFSVSRPFRSENDETYEYINEHILTAKADKTTHITRKWYYGHTIFYVHNDTVLSVFYNMTGGGKPIRCLTLINPVMARICCKSAVLSKNTEEEYYGCKNT